jgi:hypothetical protein
VSEMRAKWYELRCRAEGATEARIRGQADLARLAFGATPDEREALGRLFRVEAEAWGDAGVAALDWLAAPPAMQ